MTMAPKMDELKAKLVSLRLVKEEDWDALAAEAGDVADSETILRRLQERFAQNDSGIGERLPVLTPYQVGEILNGRTERLRLAHYVLLEPLGGGLGQVYKARNLSLPRLEAVKMIRRESADGDEARRQAEDRFRREADLLAKLQHPRLPTIHNFDDGGPIGVAYIAMEFIRGNDLNREVAEVIQAGNSVDVRQAVLWIGAVGEVLSFSHGRSVVHRDIKPGNIMLTETGNLKVLDLGLARLVRSISRPADPTDLMLSRADQVLGSPHFMSPEHWQGADHIKPPSDIYSLGCTLYYILTGQHLFPGRSLSQLSQAHQIEAPKPVSELRSDVPRWLDLLVGRMLSKSPVDRPSANELLDALNRPSGGTSPGPRFLSLGDWPHGYDVRTVLVGDRRESPPHTSADVLALSASTGDLSFYGLLGLRARIRSDKIVKFASEDKLMRELCHDIVVIGSPAANLAARIVNRGACFRFAQSPMLRQIEAKFEKELEPIAFNRLKLKEYLDPKGSTESERRAKETRVKDLRHMLQEFARAGFVDPVDYNGLRGFTRRPSNDYGVVTLCRNPWSPDHVAILAAGIGGPGTAAALKLLARPGAFAERPLGGVFEVAISQEAAWEDRYDLLDIEWDSHPYELEQFRNDLRRLVEQTSGGRIDDPAARLQDVDAIMINELIELLKRRGV